MIRQLNHDIKVNNLIGMNKEDLIVKSRLNKMKIKWLNWTKIKWNLGVQNYNWQWPLYNYITLMLTFEVDYLYRKSCLNRDVNIASTMQYSTKKLRRAQFVRFKH